MRSCCPRRLAFVVLGLLLLEPACQRPAVGGRSAPSAAHWAYGGEAGPEHWESLGPENALCGRGRAQSPVDLGPAAASGGAAPAVLRYHPAAVTPHDTGHTIQWDFAAGASMVVDGLEYALRQVHFHSPAEHPSHGVRQALELHFVHEAGGGRRAVLSVLGREGRPHPEIGRLLAAAMPGDGPRTDAVVSPEALLPEDRAAIRYDGSLTTPPCSEGVTWIVLTEPVEVAPDQLARLRAAYSGNNRPVQPLNARPLVRVPGPGH